MKYKQNLFILLILNRLSKFQINKRCYSIHGRILSFFCWPTFACHTPMLFHTNNKSKIYKIKSLSNWILSNSRLRIKLILSSKIWQLLKKTYPERPMFLRKCFYLKELFFRKGKKYSTCKLHWFLPSLFPKLPVSNWPISKKLTCSTK